jgi:hypothetical protein
MEKLMRIFGAAILAASLLVTNAFAATTLSSGKPAGVKKAQDQRNTVLIIGGVGLAGLGIALAASSNGGGPTTFTSPTTTTTTTTTTTSP